MSAPVHAAPLVGRQRELASVDALLHAARGGAGSSLMLLGEPGSGKTSLLKAARQRATDWTVLTCTGVEWEAEFPFSGLHELLSSVLEDLSALPDSQREALRGALGLDPAVDPHPFSVYVATLSLVAELARERPVLIVVDDAQWIDSGTAQAISFLSRRLEGEPIGLLVAGRPGFFLEGFPSSPVTISALDRDMVGQLVEQRSNRRAPDAILDHLLAASAGNPLAVVEAVGHYGEALWTRGTELDEPLPVGELIDRGFADRVAAVSPAALELLELISASLGDDARTLRAAATDRGLGDDTFIEAERRGMIVLEQGAIRFKHPLLRALVHRRADRHRLRACHAALARVEHAEPALRAWHLASAATAPDASVASALDEAAEEFTHRGGSLGAAQALARAAELTPDAEAKADRLFRAGRMAQAAGRGAWAVALYGEAAAVAETTLTKLQAEYARFSFLARLQPSSDYATELVEWSETVRGTDASFEIRVLSTAAMESLLAGHGGAATGLRARLNEFASRPELEPAASLVVTVILALLDIITGTEAAVGAAARSLRRFKEDWPDFEIGKASALEALVLVEDFALGREIGDALIDSCRQRGDAFLLADLLWVDGYRCFRIGEWGTAGLRYAEVQRLTATNALQYTGVTLEAVRASPSRRTGRRFPDRRYARDRGARA